MARGTRQKLAGKNCKENSEKAFQDENPCPAGSPTKSIQLDDPVRQNSRKRSCQGGGTEK